jgi:hypothetical protein
LHSGVAGRLSGDLERLLNVLPPRQRELIESARYDPASVAGLAPEYVSLGATFAGQVHDALIAHYDEHKRSESAWLCGLYNLSQRLLDTVCDEYCSIADPVIDALGSDPFARTSQLTGSDFGDLTLTVVRLFLAEVEPYQDVRSAIRRAYHAQLRSRWLTFGEMQSLDEAGDVIYGKGALGTALHGLIVLRDGDGCAPTEQLYATVLHPLGMFMAMLDDLQDIEADLDEARWSLITLELARSDSSFGATLRNMPRQSRHRFVREGGGYESAVATLVRYRARVIAGLHVLRRFDSVLEKGLNEWARLHTGLDLDHLPMGQLSWHAIN